MTMTAYDSHEITVEDLLNNPLLLDKIIRESLRREYSKRPRRVMSYISKTKGIDITGYEHSISMAIVNHLRIMMENKRVERDEFGYRLI